MSDRSICYASPPYKDFEGKGDQKDGENLYSENGQVLKATKTTARTIINEPAQILEWEPT